MVRLPWLVLRLSIETAPCRKRGVAEETTRHTYDSWLALFAFWWISNKPKKDDKTQFDKVDKVWPSWTVTAKTPDLKYSIFAASGSVILKDWVYEWASLWMSNISYPVITIFRCCLKGRGRLKGQLPRVSGFCNDLGVDVVWVSCGNRCGHWSGIDTWNTLNIIMS